MKVIFLDFDGVLNSVEWHRQNIEGGKGNGWPERHIDPAAVAVLNEVIEKTGAYVVVSSTWRIGAQRVWLQEQLAAHGFKGIVLNSTPIIREAGKVRGHEIQQWLDQAACFPHGRLGPVTHFVILDDDTDMAHLADKLVHIDDEKGLTKSYIPAILKHLEGS